MSETASAEVCGDLEVVARHGERGYGYECDLPIGHDGWHRTLTEFDEYRWKPDGLIWRADGVLLREAPHA